MAGEPGRRDEGPRDESLRRLLDRLDLGVFTIADPYAGVVTWANPAFARMFGLPSAEAAVGVSVLGTYSDPKERALLMEAFRVMHGELLGLTARTKELLERMEQAKKG